MPSTVEANIIADITGIRTPVTQLDRPSTRKKVKERIVAAGQERYQRLATAIDRVRQGQIGKLKLEQVSDLLPRDSGEIIKVHVLTDLDTEEKIGFLPLRGLIRQEPELEMDIIVYPNQGIWVNVGKGRNESTGLVKDVKIGGGLFPSGAYIDISEGLGQFSYQTELDQANQAHHLVAFATTQISG